MPRSFPVLLALLLAACSAREVEEEQPSRRHLAAQWCEDWCTFWYDCEPFFEGMSTQGCRERCEADEAWDWTDECGDIIWGYHECVTMQSCEDMRDDPDIPGADNPCQSYYDEFALQGCSYDDPDEG
ncbi:hypothetical protein [Paraliomyxa miuraensis]|uniref:hypothetical protein n=1 Tax=Paraliomyxa miuraensis TaxID=376150 RepID=UPI00225B27FA|nr:hypothetical protein [Paraliomyxa miuraensis]MCX4241343.1 hypothetical protein [Paraliomyxa miuraensis]